MKKQEIRHPGKIMRILCVDCKELLVKVYPWAVITTHDKIGVTCGKCINKANDKIRAKQKMQGINEFTK